MKLIKQVCARLQEPSTYAGLSGVCVALSTALSQAGVARYFALFGAVVTGVGAIARADNNPGLSDTLDRAASLVPELESIIVPPEALARKSSAPG